MKILAIGDIHGENHWKKIIKKYEDQVDKVIWLGDYIDSFFVNGKNQIDNLKEILEYKKNNWDKVDLLWGNHDLQYLGSSRCSGYQVNFAFEIEELFKTHLDYFQICSVYSNWLFSHAGFTEIYCHCQEHKITDPLQCNEICKDKNYKFFNFVGPQIHGDNLNEGPLWCRPRALLLNPLPNYHQVVGHTEGDKIWSTKVKGLEYHFIDVYSHDGFLMIEV